MTNLLDKKRLYFFCLVSVIYLGMSSLAFANTDLAGNQLRILVCQNTKHISFAEQERAMIYQFAAESGLEVVWKEVEHPWQLIPELLSGQGDIIVGQGASITGGMTGQVNFTSAWTNIGQLVVVRTDTTEIKSLKDLQSRQVALKKSSPHWDLMEEMAEQHRSMDLLVIPEYIDQETVMQRVATGQYDVTIADSTFLENYLPQHKELSATFDLTDRQIKAWAVHPQAHELHTALNRFLNKNHLHMKMADIHLNDLPNMQHRKILRVITYQSAANYYFDGGRFKGFEYDLLRKFARSKGMRVDMVLANSHQEMQELLLQGKGDVIAASLPVQSIDDKNISFTNAYNFSAPVIVGRESDNNLIDARGLEGRRIILPSESPYRNLLNRIRERGINFEIITPDKRINTKSTLYMVSMGMYDLTIMGNHQFMAENNGSLKVKALFTLSEPNPTAWAVRSADTLLLSAANEFIKENYRQKFYRALYARYFEWPKDKAETIFTGTESLSPYDNIVKEFAEKYDFDWRLIVAQMYQESRFNPEAVSYAGAEGLMQIMPATAEDLKTSDVYDPKSSIASGVKYLGMLRDQFEDNLLLEEKTWFSLASYNAGFNRVKQARALAGDMGLDKDKWFNNVEKAMMVLAQPFKKDGKMVRECRCGQTVVYVQEIRSLYSNYVRLTQTTQLASIRPEHTVPYDI